VRPKDIGARREGLAARQPAFAVEAGLLALHWIVEGYGYEITGRDVLDALSHTMRAAEIDGASEETRERIGQVVSRDAPDGIVRRILATRHDQAW
jgi:hypothetical protein